MGEAKKRREARENGNPWPENRPDEVPRSGDGRLPVDRGVRLSPSVREALERARRMIRRGRER